MQINRLFEIVYILLGSKAVTAAQLAQRLEVSVRTIYRDLDTLSGAGIPIYTAKGKGGGIRLMDGFILDRSLLSDKEQQDILSALQGMGATQFADDGRVLSKLSGLFHHNSHSWVSVDFSDWGDRQKEDFSLLKSAVIGRQVLSFDYHNTFGEKNNRTVEPLQLWYKKNKWYLKAYCRTKEGFRLFKMSRMRNLVLSGETFVRELPEHFDRQEMPYQTLMVPLTMKIHSSLAYRVYDEFDPDRVIKNPDGSFLVTTELLEDEWSYGYIMSFGALAEVVEPGHVRDIIRSRFRQALTIYGDAGE